MYKYKAKLLSNGEIIAEANTLPDLEGLVKKFRRGQKYGEHTRLNEKIEIIHIERDNLKGRRFSKQDVIKVV
ncbi:MAG6790 family protein [Mycoplasma sp. Ms02]|uniref:MAG6790 family protein n=1 Tax=Mycoplasma sp. Ms02 TaxID=353851 RepID=UPI001C8ACF59|nr:hypothetical protein [Mycoplasma sp. Ms02]QZE12100.1 hypothetical protein K4L35_01950 [Mycoplasma sp. Ms02]